MRSPVQTGLVIVGALASVFAGLSFLTIVLWPLGVFCAISATLLFYLATRPDPKTHVTPVAAPSYPQNWHHPSTSLPPPPPTSMPVVMPVDWQPATFIVPTPNAEGDGALVWCAHCGRPQPRGPSGCLNCGRAL